MAARTVAVRLTAEVGGYLAGLKSASSATQDLQSQVAGQAESAERNYDAIGAGLLALGGAAGAGLAVAVSKFAEFDSVMSGVRAATGETAEGMVRLKDAALEAGARTAFSASEAAQGIEALAKAGVATEDILSGGLNGALDLAAAGGLEVGEAAEIAATALTQFGLKGEDVGHVADLLAAGAGKAQGEVTDMGMALKQAGLVASQTGLTIEETTGGLAAFASAGLIGSDAGTSFKTMLQRLNPTSDEAAGLMDELGLRAYDAQGNFVGLSEYAGQLQSALGGMSAEQRNATLTTLFGSDAIRAAAVLYEQGAAGVEKWETAVNDAGFAQETAATKLDNLAGDIEAFGGSLDTALIKGGSAANDGLRTLVQLATGAVNAYSELPGPVQTAGTAVVALGAGVSILSGAALLAYPRVLSLLYSVNALGLSARATAIAMGTLKFGIVAAGATAAAVGVSALLNALADAPPSTAAFRDSIADLATGAGTTGATLKVFGKDFAGLREQLDQAGKNRIAGFFNIFDTSWDDAAIKEARDNIESLDKTLSDLATGGYPEIAAGQMDQIKRAAEEQGVSVEELAEAFPLYNDALTANSASAKLTTATTAELSKEVRLSAEEAEAAAAKLSELSAVYASFIDPLSAYTTLLAQVTEEQQAQGEKAAAKENANVDTKIKAVGREFDARLDAARKTGEVSAETVNRMEDERDRQIGALNAQKKSWEDFTAAVVVSVAGYLAELEKQVAAQTNWQANMLALSARVSQGTLDELARMGPEGAPLVAALVGASDQELARLETVFTARSQEATTAFATTMTQAKPILAAIGASSGQAVAAELAAKLANGTITVEGIMASYGISIVNGVVTPLRKAADDAGSLNAWLNVLDGREVGIKITTERISNGSPGSGGLLEYAGGGWVVGPGTSTSDSILARVSDGEFVVNARSAGQNAALLEAINSSRGFATGGWVAGQRSGSAAEVSSSTTNDRSVSVQTMYVSDWQDAERQLEQRQRLAALSGG